MAARGAKTEQKNGGPIHEAADRHVGPDSAVYLIETFDRNITPTETLAAR